MAYKEDEYLMLSGIQHFKFCRRQWALIHIEQQWSVHTVIGELMHKKVHDPSVKEKRKETLLVRALPVSSKELGVSGECDLVEFHKCEDGITLSGHRGLYSVFPVEYKKGKPKITDEDKLQLSRICRERMRCSYVHRRCVWKKCFLLQYLKGHFIMEKRGEERILHFHRNCVMK